MVPTVNPRVSSNARLACGRRRTSASLYCWYRSCSIFTAESMSLPAMYASTSSMNCVSQPPRRPSVVVHAPPKPCGCRRALCWRQSSRVSAPWFRIAFATPLQPQLPSRLLPAILQPSFSYDMAHGALRLTGATTSTCVRPRHPSAPPNLAPPLRSSPDQCSPRVRPTHVDEPS
jgi:hypothetical protein